MANTQDLTSKKCVPCEGGTKPLSEEEARPLLVQTPGWSMVDGKMITKDFAFKDFKDAVAFVNRVADLAEAEGHHPDISIHGWNKVRFELSTHAIAGLSENDFIMAAKINRL